MTTTPTKPTPFAVISLVLPGPTRKRTPSPYHFRVTYRNPEPAEPGCVMTWDVLGGRETYQVALERTDGGDHRWHCTCPDAVYRGDGPAPHRCKHVQGLLELFGVVQLRTAAA
jgi:hypothetical protein